MLMGDAPDQEALFEIEGPDEDGCVWIGSPEGRLVSESRAKGQGSRSHVPVAGLDRLSRERVADNRIKRSL